MDDEIRFPGYVAAKAVLAEARGGKLVDVDAPIVIEAEMPAMAHAAAFALGSDLPPESENPMWCQ